MAAVSVTVNLEQPYELRKAEIDAIEKQGKSLAEWRRDFTDNLIMAAAQAMYAMEAQPDGAVRPGGLDRKQGRIFAKIRAELNRETPTIELDGTQFEWLCDLFLSREAETKFKVPPQHAVFFYVWLDYLAGLRASVTA